MQVFEIEDEAGNIDLCECDGTRVIRVIRRVVTAKTVDFEDRTYAIQYAYACGYHD